MSYSNGNIPTQGTHFSDGVRVGKNFAGAGKMIVNNNSAYATAENDVPFGYSLGAPGIPISPRYTWITQPNAPSFTSLVSNPLPTSIGPGYLTLTPTATTPTAIVNGERVLQLKMAATLVVTRVESTLAANIYVWGYDYGNIPMMEQLTVAAGDTGKTGQKAFKSIAHIYVDQAGTWKVGDRDIYGLPYYISDFGFLSSPCWDQFAFPASGWFNPPAALTSPATATSTDVRGLILVNGTNPNGLLYLCVDMYVQGAQGENQTVAGLYGVPQYTQPLFPPL